MELLPELLDDVKLIWKQRQGSTLLVDGRVILSDFEISFCSNNGKVDLTATYAALEGVQGGRMDGAAASWAVQHGFQHLYCVDLQFKSCHRWRMLFRLEPVMNSDGQGISGWSDIRGINFINSITQRKQIPASASVAPPTSTPPPQSSPEPSRVTPPSSPGGPSASNSAPNAATSPPITKAADNSNSTAGAAIEAIPERFIYSFAYRLPFDVSPELDGWGVYDARREWERQFEAVSPKYRWRISDVNKDFAVCPSYPRVLCFPPNFDPILAFKAAEFRDASRIPVLAWLDTDTLASISRCAQPLPGRLGNKRCEEDELLVTSIFRATPTHPRYGGVLIDARPYQNAVANRALGAGFEKTENYMNCQIEFLGIENIHVMRDSLEKLKKLTRQLVLPLSATTASGGCNLTQSGGVTTISQGINVDELIASMGSISLSDSWNWFSRLADTSWLRHLASVLGGAVRVAHLVHREHVPVLVHCSHGWDRTSQLVALAELILDPYYRTLRGFQVLVEKEWVSFGFKFYDRCHSQTNEVAPIFLQFIDAVWQITRQHPREFEFNEAFLLFIVDQVYGQQFGTFLANSERHREMLRLRQRTVSIWSFVNHPKQVAAFKNPLYKPSNDKMLHVSAAPTKIALWESLYNRSENTAAGATVIDDLVAEIAELRKHLAGQSATSRTS